MANSTSSSKRSPSFAPRGRTPGSPTAQYNFSEGQLRAVCPGGGRAVCPGGGRAVCQGVVVGGGEAVCQGVVVGGGEAVCQGVVVGGGEAVCQGVVVGGGEAVCQGVVVGGGEAVCQGVVVGGGEAVCQGVVVGGGEAVCQGVVVGGGEAVCQGVVVGGGEAVCQGGLVGVGAEPGHGGGPEDLVARADRLATAALSLAKAYAAAAVAEKDIATARSAETSSSQGERSFLSCQKNPSEHSFCNPTTDEEAEDDNDRWMREMGIEHQLPPNEEPNPLWAKRTVRLVNNMAREDKQDLKDAELYSPNGIRRARQHPNSCNHLSAPKEIRVSDGGTAHVPDDIITDGSLRQAPYVYHGLEQLGLMVQETPRKAAAETSTTTDTSQLRRSLEETTSTDVFGQQNEDDAFNDFQEAGEFDGDVLFPPPDYQSAEGDAWDSFQQPKGADESFGAAPNPDADDQWNRMLAVIPPEVAKTPTPPATPSPRKRAATPDDEEEPWKKKKILEPAPSTPTPSRKRGAVRDDEDPAAKKVPAAPVAIVQMPVAPVPVPPAPARLIIPTRQRVLNRIERVLESLQERMTDIQEVCEAYTGDTTLLDIVQGLNRKRSTLIRMRKELPLVVGLDVERRLDILVGRIDELTDAIPDAPVAPAPRFRRRAGVYRH